MSWSTADIAPMEDSDRSGHPWSLIKVFAVRWKKVWVLVIATHKMHREDWSDWSFCWFWSGSGSHHLITRSCVHHFGLCPVSGHAEEAKISFWVASRFHPSYQIQCWEQPVAESPNATKHWSGRWNSSLKITQRMNLDNPISDEDTESFLHICDRSPR